MDLFAAWCVKDLEAVSAALWCWMRANDQFLEGRPAAREQGIERQIKLAHEERIERIIRLIKLAREAYVESHEIASPERPDSAQLLPSG
jgi:hypothetical protein